MLNFLLSEHSQNAIKETRNALDTIRKFLGVENATNENFLNFQTWFFEIVQTKLNEEFEDYFFENIEKVS